MPWHNRRRKSLPEIDSDDREAGGLSHRLSFKIAQEKLSAARTRPQRTFKVRDDAPCYNRPKDYRRRGAVDPIAHVNKDKDGLLTNDCSFTERERTMTSAILDVENAITFRYVSSEVRASRIPRNGLPLPLSFLFFITLFIRPDLTFPVRRATISTRTQLHVK